jgi:signal peptidase I
VPGRPVLTAALIGTFAGIGAWIRLRRRYAVVRIDGASMEPTYRSGDRVLVHRVPVRRLAVGDVVVVERPDPAGNWWHPPLTGAVDRRPYLIKRVAALPGDRVPRDVRALRHASGQPVPQGSVVVLGDASTGSWDSRSIGYLPLSRVLGRVLRRLPEADRWRPDADVSAVCVHRR